MNLKPGAQGLPTRRIGFGTGEPDLFIKETQFKRKGTSGTNQETKNIGRADQDTTQFFRW